MSFSLAIIGRPNVGKSTLFNRLVGKKLALVDDRPGVTRDRREGAAKLADLSFTVIDTAGLEEGAEATLEGRMRQQTEAAIDQADAILFMIDARAGVTPDDKYFADLVRRAGKPVVLAANKAEGRAGEAGFFEAYTLGLGDPVPLSAEHGEGMIDLFDALRLALPEATEAPIEEDEAAAPRRFDDEDGSDLDITKPLRITVVGRPNAGKSTLINRLLGEERLLVGPEAGITRDSIGIDFEWRDRKMKLFDTAGLRRRARVTDKLEKLAGADALRAVRFSEVVVLLVDFDHSLREAGFDHRRYSGERRARGGHRPGQMGFDRGSRQDTDKIERRSRAAARPDTGMPGCSGLRRDRRGARRADAGGDRRARDLEQAHLDRASKPLVNQYHRTKPAARGLGPPHQNPLYDAAQKPSAAFRAVRQSARRTADEL